MGSTRCLLNKRGDNCPRASCKFNVVNAIDGGTTTTTTTPTLEAYEEEEAFTGGWGRVMKRSSFLSLNMGLLIKKREMLKGEWNEPRAGVAAFQTALCDDAFLRDLKIVSLLRLWVTSRIKESGLPSPPLFLILCAGSQRGSAAIYSYTATCIHFAKRFFSLSPLFPRDTPAQGVRETFVPREWACIKAASFSSRSRLTHQTPL